MKTSARLRLPLLLALAASGAMYLRAEPATVLDKPREAAPVRPSPEPPVDPVVGKWAWHDHVLMTLRADGTGTASTGDEVAWKATHSQPGAHTYDVIWRSGPHDELIFNDGAQTALLIGDKQENYTARRIPDPIVGKWDWHHHQSVTFAADGTCESTDGMRGTWRFVDGPDAERRYAIVFDNGRYQDELTFHKDGRTALLVGSSRENYTVSKAVE